MEVTFVKYLEVLKMSYIVMCFSKLIMIILKSISKDSNIKLHSKLLKAYLKENYNILLKDKNICLLLELIRMDIFILKDKETNLKKKNIENLIHKTINLQNSNYVKINDINNDKNNENDNQLLEENKKMIFKSENLIENHKSIIIEFFIKIKLIFKN